MFSRSFRLVSLAGLALAALAQNQAKAPAALSILVTKVKPDRVQEWEALQKAELMPALKKGGTAFRSLSQTAVFGDLYTFVSVTPIDSFAMYGGETVLTKALGAEGARQLLAKSAPMVVESHRYAMRPRPDLSIRKETGQPAPLSLVTFIRVATGRNADFERLIRNDVLPALRKADVDGYWLHESILGGNAGDWVSVIPMRSFAELDKPHPLARGMGEAAFQKFNARTAGIIISLERSLSRMRPELSFGPQTPE